MSKGGSKNDSGKPRLSLVPKEAYWGMAAALTFGAQKYAPDNFKLGIDYRRISDAALRHITAFMDGEELDPESGLSHLDHALASLAMLKYMSVNVPACDDRFKKNE